MKKVKILYDKMTCIGNGACVIENPENFVLQNNKADLIGSKPEAGKFILEKEVSEEEYEKIIEAAKKCPVNAIEVEEEGEKVVSSEIVQNEVKEITGQFDNIKDFVMEPKGYFLIRIDKDKKLIEAAFCPEVNKITHKIVGKNPQEVYMTIIKEDLISRLDHAAYLGKELQKAYIALQKGIDYVQDDPLNL